MSHPSAIAQLQHQRHLLSLEYQEEKENYRQQTENIGLARKVTRGDAWFPLKIGRTYYNSLNQYCIEVTRHGDEEIDHNFEYGRPIVFFSAEAPSGDLKQATAIHFFGFTGSVSFVDGNRMVAAIPEGHALELQNAQKSVGVQLFFAIPTAILLRASKFGAATGTFISNHFTIFIIYPIQCYLGARIINKPISYGGIKIALRKLISEQSYEAFSALSSELCLAFLIGGVIFAMILTPITYTVVLQLVNRHRSKRASRTAKSDAPPPKT